MSTPGESPAPRAPSPPGEAEQALHWLHQAGAQRELLGEISRQVRRRARRRAAGWGGAVAALVLGIAAWRFDATPAAVPLPESPVATAIVTAPQQLVLADGSQVALRGDATITHELTDTVRRVVLQRGEAHFQVAQEPARPFVVLAAGVEVRAVGTAFSVQLGGSDVEVLVTHGSVAVGAPAKLPHTTNQAAPQPQPTPPALLQAGDRAVIRLTNITPEVTTLPPAELARRLAWRIPQLEFSRTPLPEVVALMNAHLEPGRRVLVLDPASPDLAGVKLSGFLAADNIDGLLQLLQTNFNIEIQESAAAITLRKRP
jgi:transmembrane sensor